jgi:hypothetical protein
MASFARLLQSARLNNRAVPTTVSISTANFESFGSHGLPPYCSLSEVISFFFSFPVRRLTKVEAAISHDGRNDGE